MRLESWTHHSSAGLTLRGAHSRPSGKPVLHFLHGNGFCARTYDPLLTLLSRDFDLFLSDMQGHGDLQGHGDSDPGGRFHGWHRTAELCREAWQAHAGRFGETPAHVLGHSFGGIISALMMAEDASLFKRAVLLDPVLFPPAMMGLMALSDVVGLYSRNTLALRARKRRRHWPDREAAFQALRGRGMFSAWQDEALRAYIDHALRASPDGGVELKCSPALEAQIYGAFPRRLWSALGRVANPTLVLYGQRTFPFLPQAVTRWCSTNHHISSLRMAGGHCFMQQDPASSAERIRDFLR